MRAALALVAAAALAVGCGGGGGAKPSGPLPSTKRTMRLTSPAFRPGAEIPARFTCDGANVSPPLAISAAPRRARELALVVFDPDAGGFVHWTVLRIAPRTTGIREGQAPAGAIQTKNSFGKSGWGGPCPPKGDPPHRYAFDVYALDAPLGLGVDASPDDVRTALARHSIARGMLVGRYGR